MKTTSLIKGSVLLLGFIFIFSGCSKNYNESYDDLVGSWKVIYFKKGNKKITKTKENTWPDINNGDITANFSETDGNGRGTISGIKVSNGYSGEYSIGKKDKISIGPIIQTEINEPEWTKLYNISGAETFKIKKSRLFIYYDNKKYVIVFERI